MKSLTASEARIELFRLIKDARKSHRTFTITHKDGDVVLISKEDYESLIETLELLSIPDSINPSRRQKRRLLREKPLPWKRYVKRDDEVPHPISPYRNKRCF